MSGRSVRGFRDAAGAYQSLGKGRRSCEGRDAAARAYISCACRSPHPTAARGSYKRRKSHRVATPRIHPHNPPPHHTPHPLPHLLFRAIQPGSPHPDTRTDIPPLSSSPDSHHTDQSRLSVEPQRVHGGARLRRRRRRPWWRIRRGRR